MSDWKTLQPPSNITDVQFLHFMTTFPAPADNIIQIALSMRPYNIHTF